MNFDNSALQCPWWSFPKKEANATLWRVLSDLLGDVSPWNLELVSMKSHDVKGPRFTRLLHSPLVYVGVLAEKYIAVIIYHDMRCHLDRHSLMTSCLTEISKSLTQLGNGTPSSRCLGKWNLPRRNIFRKCFSPLMSGSKKISMVCPGGCT